MKYHRHLMQSCATALEQIFFENRYADKCIEYHMRNNKKWGGRDRRFFAETVYDCVRWWRLYWHLINKPQSSEKIIDLIPVSLWKRDLPLPEDCQLRASELEARYQQIKDPAIRHSLPEWLWSVFASQFGPRADEIARALNSTNKLVVRVNTNKIQPQELLQKINQEGFDVRALLGTEAGLIFSKKINIFSTPFFKQGFLEVQDGASQQVADYLDIQPGQRVIDACAGAGGKTLHISNKLQDKGRVLAMDIHDWKLRELKLRARRNQCSNIEVRTIESSKTIKRLYQSADRLLLDVPCSGLGVLRRNPDSKWKLSPERLHELESLQTSILHDYSAMLKPGGKLVYATCSLLSTENENQVAHFLEKNKNFKLIKQRWIWPVQEGYDGFYMALLQKN